MKLGLCVVKVHLPWASKLSPCGRYLTRLALFLVGKGSKGPEGKNYKQFEDITDLFTQELMNMKAHGSMDLAEQLPSSSASVDKAVQPTAFGGKVFDQICFLLVYIATLSPFGPAG